MIRIPNFIFGHIPFIGLLFRNSRDLILRNKASLPTPWGFLFAGNSQMAEGSFEPEETKMACELLQTVDVLVNIGANVGYYCCHALRLGKPVIAVEPILSNLYYLMRNISENGWSQQAEIFPVALGAKTGVMNMWGGGTGASLVKGWAGVPESYVTQVPVLTLDRIIGNTLEDKRALVLIDVEGAEYGVMQGASKILCHNPRPIWMVEICSTEHQPEGVTINPNLIATFNLFFEQGYRATSLDALRTPVDIDFVKAVAEGRAQFQTHSFVFESLE